MEQQIASDDAPAATDDITELDNVGPKRAKQFRDHDIETGADMAECPHLIMMNIVGGYTGAEITNQAKDIVRSEF